MNYERAVERAIRRDSFFAKRKGEKRTVQKVVRLPRPRTPVRRTFDQLCLNYPTDPRKRLARIACTQDERVFTTMLVIHTKIQPAGG